MTKHLIFHAVILKSAEGSAIFLRRRKVYVCNKTLMHYSDINWEINLVLDCIAREGIVSFLINM